MPFLLLHLLKRCHTQGVQLPLLWMWFMGSQKVFQPEKHQSVFSWLALPCLLSTYQASFSSLQQLALSTVSPSSHSSPPLRVQQATAVSPSNPPSPPLPSSPADGTDITNSDLSSLHILQFNCNGIRHSKQELQDFLISNKIAVAALQETKLRNSHDFSIPG